MAEHPQFEIVPAFAAEAEGFTWRYREAPTGEADIGNVTVASTRWFSDRDSAEGDVIRFIESITAHSGAPAAFIEPSTGIEYVIAHVEEA